jgi:hypothetical protein
MLGFIIRLESADLAPTLVVCASMLMLSIGAFFSLLVADRKILRWSLFKQGLLVPVLILIVNLGMGSLFFLPLLLKIRSEDVFSWDLIPKLIVTLASAATLFITIAAFFIILFMVTLLCHRIAWPLFARPLYALAQYRLLQNHLLMGTLGVSCLLAAFPNSALLLSIKSLF